MKKLFSGMLLLSGLSVLILAGCYEKQAEAPKAPEAVAPAASAPSTAPSAEAPAAPPAAK
ncbi:MAG: hypothetical protein HY202_07880 [Nitrospirae bacterium]|nr:hypothetical protein [Nitrospirota bacterium]MBI3605929.1 hypothetical protein [Nitrospirota bacterium]